MEYREVAIQAARHAGELLQSYFDIGLEGDKKDESGSLVSKADKEAEEIIIGLIQKYFPDHAILGEESGHTKTESDYRWIIDPLDGTSNFLFGLDIFCVSIALEHKGERVLGVIYDPIRNTLYVGEKGKGATRNGIPMRVSTETDFSHQFFLVGTGSSDKQARQQMIDFMRNNTQHIRRWREYGSAAMKLTSIAHGKAVAYVTYNIHLWDFAAAEVLVKEAGGQVSIFPKEGSDGYVLVASNGVVHDKVLELAGV